MYFRSRAAHRDQEATEHLSLSEGHAGGDPDSLRSSPLSAAAAASHKQSSSMRSPAQWQHADDQANPLVVQHALSFVPSSTAGYCSLGSPFQSPGGNQHTKLDRKDSKERGFVVFDPTPSPSRSLFGGSETGGGVGGGGPARRSLRRLACLSLLLLLASGMKSPATVYTGGEQGSDDACNKVA